MRRGTTSWVRELAQQLVHSLALLLWLTAPFAPIGRATPLAIATAIVIVVNALFAR